MVSEVRDKIPSKAESPIVFTELGILIEVSRVPQNAQPPMLITELPISTVLSQLF